MLEQSGFIVIPLMLRAGINGSKESHNSLGFSRAYEFTKVLRGISNVS